MKNECFESLKSYTFSINNVEISNFYQNFSESKDDLPFLYMGSGGFIEIGINKMNASKILKIDFNDKINLKNKTE